MFLRSRIRRLWTDSLRFHGKPCTLLALGVRVCDTAMTHLGLSDPGWDRLVCVSEHDGCCVDAIQMGLHCTSGRKHLLYYKTGRLIFTVYDLESGASVRICALPELAAGEPEVLGPAPAPVMKLNNRYRYRCLLVGKNDRPTREAGSWLLKAFANDRANRGMNLFVDCNSME